MVRLQRILCRGSDAIFAVQRGYFLVQAGIFLVQRGAFLVHGGVFGGQYREKGAIQAKIWGWQDWLGGPFLVLVTKDAGQLFPKHGCRILVTKDFSVL